MANFHYTIYADGGSRGNPGPAAFGYVIEGEDIDKKEHGEYIGETTNNIAEYSAVIAGLKKLKHILGGDKAATASVGVFADSELLVRQVNGEYKIRDEGIQKLFLELWNLRLDFGDVVFTHIPREKNHGADRMVNAALDREAAKLDL